MQTRRRPIFCSFVLAIHLTLSASLGVTVYFISLLVRISAWSTAIKTQDRSLIVTAIVDTGV